jgi:hypothetical protein
MTPARNVYGSDAIDSYARNRIDIVTRLTRREVPDPCQTPDSRQTPLNGVYFPL